MYCTKSREVKYTAKITVNERRTSQKAIIMGDFNLPLSTLDRSNGST